MPAPVFSEELLLKLKLMFTYDPETGVFRRRDGRNRNRPLKDPAKTAKTYKQINVDGEIHYAHMMAWWFMTGAPVPEGYEIDHKNRNKQDASWANLRLRTRGRNANNLTLRSDNTSGVTGVKWSVGDQKWLAEIVVDGKLYGLGGHSNFQDAVHARINGELHHLGEIVSTYAIGGVSEPGIAPDRIRAKKPDQRLTKAYARAVMEKRCELGGSPHPGIVRLASGRYQAKFRNKVIASYDTLDEALAARRAVVDAYYAEE